MKLNEGETKTVQIEPLEVTILNKIIYIVSEELNSPWAFCTDPDCSSCKTLLGIEQLLINAGMLEKPIK
jgi:hypothetical protein